MAKRSNPGRCVHCGEHVENLTWDHVFPRGWYPDNSPHGIEKWKVPSCRQCNAEYGEIEDELGILIPLCMGPGAPEASGLYEKALRALDPSKGRNRKDQQRRARKREKILGQMLHGEEIPENSVYPGFEEKWGRTAEERVGLPMPANAMRRLVEKIIKGITYLENERYLGDTAEIQHHVVREEDVSQIRDWLGRHGERHSRSPGIEVVRAVAPEDGVSAIYRIEIWGRFVMYASVIESTTQQPASADAEKPRG